MEADIAAIREAVAVIQWCCTVLAFTFVPWVGMYLFRLTIIARDRFNKKIIGLAAACLLANDAFAQGCPESKRAIPSQNVDDNPGGLPAGNWDWSCAETSSAVITAEAGDCDLFAGGTYRLIKIKLRGHDDNAGMSTATDVDVMHLVWVLQFAGEDDALVATKVYWRLHNGQGDWKACIGAPPILTCDCDVGCGNHCVYACVADYYESGSAIAWPPGRSIVEQYDAANLSCCGGAGGDTDGDGIPDALDPDDDNDGMDDGQDPDDDGDGLPDEQDPDHDGDGDGIPNGQDPDDDGDGVPDGQDPDHPDGPNPPGDGDGDGIPDGQDPDDDNDGIPDGQDPDHDADGDGVPDGQDPDDDGDGVPDGVDPDADPDGDGIPNEDDDDDDGDGTPDEPDDPDDPDDPDEPEGGGACGEHMGIDDLARVMGGRMLGFEHVLLDDVAADWESQQGEGLRIPYMEPTRMIEWNWDWSWIKVSPAGVMTIPGAAPFEVPHWGEVASTFKTAFGAILLIGYVQAFFGLVMGGGES